MNISFMASDLHAEQEQETEREEESPRAEFSSKTGSREYLGYYTFSTPVGNGTVEYSSGNLLYSQEDVQASHLHIHTTKTFYLEV